MQFAGNLSKILQIANLFKFDSTEKDSFSHKLCQNIPYVYVTSLTYRTDVFHSFTVNSNILKNKMWLLFGRNKNNVHLRHKFP